MSDLEIGQVIALKIRFNNRGTVSVNSHPYLVVGIDKEFDVIEVAQIDSLEGKEYKAAFKSNKTIFCDEPAESVIDKHSYVQLDNTLKIENFPAITQFRRQKDKLSKDKLSDVLRAYYHYHQTHKIDENKNVYMDEAEILQLNG